MAAAVDIAAVPVDIDIVPVAVGTAEAVPVPAGDAVAATTVDPADSVALVEAVPAVAVGDPAPCFAAVDLALTAVMGFGPTLCSQLQAHPSLVAWSGEGASLVVLRYMMWKPVFVV